MGERTSEYVAERNILSPGTPLPDTEHLSGVAIGDLAFLGYRAQQRMQAQQLITRNEAVDVTLPPFFYENRGFGVL
jgi:hypothetical protein